MTDGPTIVVDARALGQLLHALVGPPHLIREIQVTRNLPVFSGAENPLDTLIKQYNTYVADLQSGEKDGT